MFPQRIKKENGILGGAQFMPTLATLPGWRQATVFQGIFLLQRLQGHPCRVAPLPLGLAFFGHRFRLLSLNE
jgi:hypothetical protein